ncbi:hypothetical protein GGX14DRAFT_675070 [Mycena pura]|uniref:HMG box domain-containing protein n=1 Tax=Mycena pura TaxID=153505 RepID=A0AAD6VSA5_9AGAR|nr:hypothetical protein GGX14DRAFT_675070 [Mycena pura]
MSVSRDLLARRTFMTSTRLSLPVAAAKSSAVKKPTATRRSTKKAPPKKKTPAKRAVPKKAALKKRVARKVAAPKRRVRVVKKKKPASKILSLRLTKSLGPPRRGSSAYIFFFKEYRAKNKHLSIVDSAAACAAEWKTLSDEQKQASFYPYVAQSAANVAHQRQEIDKWLREVDPKILRLINKQRRAKNLRAIKNPFAPKRPTSGFITFFQEHRATMQGSSITDTAKNAGAAWQALPASQRDAYILAARDRMEAFKQLHSKQA